MNILVSTLSLLAVKGRLDGKNGRKGGAIPDDASPISVKRGMDEGEMLDLFDFPFLEDPDEEDDESIGEGDIGVKKTDLIPQIKGLEEEEEGGELSWEEMRSLYGDIEDILIHSMEEREPSEEVGMIYVHEEGVIGLPVKPSREPPVSSGVIELRVKQQPLSGEDARGTIELPTKPLAHAGDGPLEDVIELPTKPAHSADSDMNEGSIPLPVKTSDKVRASEEETVILPGPRSDGRTDVIEIDLSASGDVGEADVARGAGRRAILKRLTGETEGSKKKVSKEELKRLKELRTKQREAIRKRLKERKSANVSWGELVNAKEKRAKRLEALRIKRKSRRTRKRKEKLQRLKRKEKKTLHSVRKVQVEPGEEKEKEKEGTADVTAAESRERRYPTLDRVRRDEKRSSKDVPVPRKMAVPPREAFKAAPVVPGVTFAAIKKCPDCGGFVNLGVSNKCYSCGKAL